MSESMSKGKRLLFLFTLMFSNVIIMESYILSPTFAALYEMYPAQVGLVNFVVSGSYLIVIAASPLASMLCDRFGEKPVLLAGGVLAATGGILMSGRNIVMMCAMRCLYTVGYAFTQIAAVAIINKFYEDENKRGFFMGYYNASMTVIGAIFSVLAGNMAVRSIDTAYRLHWIFVPYLILALLFIPSMGKSSPREYVPAKRADAEPAKKGKEKMGRAFLMAFAGIFLFNIVYGIISLFVSVYVAENALGTEALTGYLNMVQMIIGFAASMAFGILLQKLSHKIRVTVYVLMASGTAFYWLLPSRTAAFLLFAIMGTVYSMMNSYAFAALPGLAPESRANDVIALVTVSATLASFVSSYFTTFYMKALHASYTDTLYIPLMIIAAVAVFALIRTAGAGKPISTAR